MATDLEGRGPRARLPRDRASAEPQRVWGAFVDLLTSAGYDELTSLQRVAYLAFHYDAEVTSGGHARFLRNVGAARVGETLSALARLGAAAQGEVLRRAARVAEGDPAAAAAAAAGLDRLDDEFHACSPEIHLLLRDWLERHLDQFVVIDG